jgi:UDP-glucose 4-epimerase
MNILVTGGAGFIGSHVADALIAEGHKIWIIDDLSSGVPDNLPAGAEFLHCDVRDPKVGALIRSCRFDAIYHLAAQMDVRKSVRDPLFDLQVNIGGSVQLLEWCREYGVKRFIFSSTGGAIYGEQDYFPAREDHPTRPVSPYGVAKLSVERYMFFYHTEYGLNATALRYANVYGPRQNPHGEAGVVAIFAGKMLKGEQALVNGDGLQTRDYLFVSDVARLNLLSLSLEGFNILNAGTGVETDVVTLFDELNRLTGSKTRRSHRDAAVGEQRRSSIDASLALRKLNWKPEIGLEEGLAQTVEFFRNKLA